MRWLLHEPAAPPTSSGVRCAVREELTEVTPARITILDGDMQGSVYLDDVPHYKAIRTVVEVWDVILRGLKCSELTRAGTTNDPKNFPVVGGDRQAIGLPCV